MNTDTLAPMEVGFARSGDIDVAYHVVGDGPVDLVYVEGAYTHLEVAWELPPYRRFCERLAEFARLIRFDKRGMGVRREVAAQSVYPCGITGHVASEW